MLIYQNHNITNMIIHKTKGHMTNQFIESP